MIWQLLYWTRNVIWQIRRAIKGDIFEIEAQEWDFCFKTKLTEEQVIEKLLENGFVLKDMQEIPQYEYTGQIFGAHKYVENGHKQFHVRLMENSNIHSHYEWSWQKHAYKHLKGIDAVRRCDIVQSLKGD